MALDWTGRRVLITGCAGFVGSHLARMLVNAGADVIGLDMVRDSPSLRVLGVSEMPILIRDVTDWQRVHWAMLRGNGEREWRPPEVVFHLAGKSHISECQRDPIGAWTVNVQGTWAVLEACRNLPGGQIKAVVVASSNHVYGARAVKAATPSFPLIPIPFSFRVTSSQRGISKDEWIVMVKPEQDGESLPEQSPMLQHDAYGTSKACADLIARSYGRSFGLPVAALRHVNCFGEADPHRSHIVTGTICDILEGNAPVIRGDGSAIKGYLHVEDVVRAYLVLAESLIDGRLVPGRSLNAGGPPMSVMNLVEAILHVADSDLAPDIRNEDLSQSGYLEILYDAKLRALGWTPGPLREGLRRTWGWYQKMGGVAWLSA